MKAAFYDRLGPARDVLQLGEVTDPLPAAGEVRVRIEGSGINPSDVKSRLGLRVGTMPFPRVIPHSDGMGVIDAVGDGVPSSRLCQPAPQAISVLSAILRFARVDASAGHFPVLVLNDVRQR